jgi:hypothetical protein
MSAGERSMQGTASRDIRPTSRATLQSLCICSLGSVCSSGLATCCYHSQNKESVCSRGSPNRWACRSTSHLRVITTEGHRGVTGRMPKQWERVVASAVPPLFLLRVQASDMLLQGYPSLSFLALSFSHNVLLGYRTYPHIPSHPREPYE